MDNEKISLVNFIMTANELVTSLDKLKAHVPAESVERLACFHKEAIALARCAFYAKDFYEDVMPQISKLAIQDYYSVNELGMLTRKIDTDLSSIDQIT